MKERIQKVLSTLGYGSRREIERWIQEGRIKVNKKIAQLGHPILSSDHVEIDGKAITLVKEHFVPARVLLYHKPEGEVCTVKDPEGRPTVFANLPKLELGRWIGVGRLDMNTSGLLLMTTDGELANRLMHPRYQIKRTYACRVFGEATPEQRKNLLQGVEIEGERMAFTKILDMEGSGHNQWYRVTLAEGKNREVRKLWESQGLKVNRLIRLSYGDIDLPRNLKAGEFKELAIEQINALRVSVELPQIEPLKVSSQKQSTFHRRRTNNGAQKRLRAPFKKAYK